MEHGLQQEQGRAQGMLAGQDILVLEDQFEVADLLNSAIEGAGGTVLALVSTVDEALAAIRESAISVAVITMIADGIYTDLVAQELTLRGVPFVVTTGIGTDVGHPALHAAPAITKPFQASHVQASLAELLTGN